MKLYTEQELRDLITWRMWTDKQGLVTIRGSLLLTAQEVVDPDMIRQTDIDLQEHVRSKLQETIINHCHTSEREAMLNHFRKVKEEAFTCPEIYNHKEIHEGVLYGRKL